MGLPWAGCNGSNGYEEYDENLGSAFLETERGILYHVSYRHLTSTCEGRIISESSGNYPADERSVNCSKSSAVKPTTLIGYFNGVANTEINARASLDRLRNEFPSTTAKPIEHDLFYNQTGCTPGLLGKIDCVEDLVEVFQQYDAQFRQLLGNTGWEIFWEIMNGSYMKPGSYSLKLLSLIKFTPQRILLSNLIQRVAKSMMVRIGMHLVTLLKQPPTAADTAGHIAKLKSYADKGTGMVLVAHSQGNLFVNAAFDGIKTSVPGVKAKAVHVGTAAPKLNGDYVLADIDIVINVLLRASVPMLPDSNTPLTFNPVELSGHQFEGTYLDKTRASYAKVVGLVNAALDGVR